MTEDPHHEISAFENDDSHLMDRIPTDVPESEPNPLLEISAFKIDEGQLIGRVPADVPIDFLLLNFSAQKPLEALQARCLDCCCNDASEVRKCVATDCPSWPFRMGNNPFRKKIMLSEAERQRRTALLQAARPQVESKSPDSGLHTAPRHGSNPQQQIREKEHDEDTSS